MLGDSKMMRVREVAACLDVGVRTIWQQVARGTIPQPVRIGKRLVRWVRSDFERWLKEKVDLAEQERKKLSEIGKI